MGFYYLWKRKWKSRSRSNGAEANLPLIQALANIPEFEKVMSPRRLGITGNQGAKRSMSLRAFPRRNSLIDPSARKS